MEDRELYLGSEIDGLDRIHLDMDHLTTHAVCLGMTGSGKTGLGIVALEELARRGVPLLVIDLKGDMVDLLLNFPDLEPDSFAPWLPADELEDRDPEEVAKEQAEKWRRGLKRSGLDSSDMAKAKQGVEWQLLTPGVASVAPLDILPTLSAPAGWDPAADPDAATDRVNGVVAALLSLVGRGGDPLSDRDHVLTSTVVLEHWARGDGLDLGGLLASLADPPIEVLGALPLDVFYPRDDRMKLVMALNTLLASPAFAAWTRGTPLTMEALLGTRSRPRASVITLAHLDERQRLFVIGLLVSELVAWMRRQPASSGLRALLYMDEVFGILPPHPANPPTKRPLLTLFKQGRAFGVGAWLATQNPVDLDYKALGNAGVKLVGRLITDRDRSRALEGLGISTLDDGRNADDVVAQLGKREFLLDDVREEPRVRFFSSRWAMSYLRGPVTLAEMGRLAGKILPEQAQRTSQMGPATSPAPAEPKGASSPPVLQQDVDTLFGWSGGGVATPSILIRNSVSVSRKSLDFSRKTDEEWWIPVNEKGALRWEDAELLDTLPDLVPEPPEGMVFAKAAPGRLGKEAARAGRGFVSWRARRPIEVLANGKLHVVAGEEEGREDFIERCLDLADRADDATQERTRLRYEKKMKSIRKRLSRERDELERDRQTAASRKAEESLGLVEGLFSVLLGSKSIRSASRKAASKVKTAAGKRRMRQTAEGSVTESVREIERLEDELEDLAGELQDEIDRIAEESQLIAERVETVEVRPIQRDIEVTDVWLVWS
jgi:Helicase HerA, central domain